MLPLKLCNNATIQEVWFFQENSPQAKLVWMSKKKHCHAELESNEVYTLDYEEEIFITLTPTKC